MLDSYSNRLVNYLMEQYQPTSKEDVLRIALYRADSKLSKVYQTIRSLEPIMDF